MTKKIIRLATWKVSPWYVLLLAAVLNFSIIGAIKLRQRSRKEIVENKELNIPVVTSDKIESELKTQINQWVVSKKLKAVSVYYEDLTSGQVISINPDEKYSPCSLLKIFVMMDVLKAAETNKDLLNLKVKYRQKLSFNLQNVMGKGLVLGREYTVDSLLYYMVNQSDNEASVLLSMMARNYGWDKSEKYFAVNKGVVETNYLKMSKIMLALKAIYFHLYLNEDMSNKAIAYMTNSLLPDGIPSGVPGGVVVAHKFGELSTENAELHDCGIVYLAGKPYLLGIMTNSNQLQDGADAIKEVSGMVYQYVSAENPS